MPRKSKNQSANVTSPGQPYGIASEQQAAMNVVPLPNTEVNPVVNSETSQPPVTSLPLGAAPTANVDENVNSMQPVIDAAKNSPAPAMSSFSAPTERPDEPITTMPSAPAFVPNNAANIIRMIAKANGDDSLYQVAADVERLRY